MGYLLAAWSFFITIGKGVRGNENIHSIKMEEPGQVLQLAKFLEANGFEVDAFCRSTDKRYAFHWSELVDDEKELASYDAIEMLTDPRTQRVFKEDRKWLDWADCVIMLMPCGRSSHLEAGYAKGQGKFLFIYGEFIKGEFDVMYGFADGLFRTSQAHSMLTELKRLK